MVKLGKLTSNFMVTFREMKTAIIGSLLATIVSGQGSWYHGPSDTQKLVDQNCVTKKDGSAYKNMDKIPDDCCKVIAGVEKTNIDFVCAEGDLFPQNLRESHSCCNTILLFLFSRPYRLLLPRCM